MNNLNQHLIIPPHIQAILDEIENIPLYYAEVDMEAHPKFPQYDRFLRVEDFGGKSSEEFVYIKYEQILKDKETGEEMPYIKLPNPEWIVYADTWSFFRTADGQPLELPLIEPTEGKTTDKVRVPSYCYMLWLMKNHNARFLELIEGYAVDFIRSKIDELNG